LAHLAPLVILVLTLIIGGWRGELVIVLAGDRPLIPRADQLCAVFRVGARAEFATEPSPMRSTIICPGTRTIICSRAKPSGSSTRRKPRRLCPMAIRPWP
jgi:hypothetical protein